MRNKNNVRKHGDDYQTWLDKHGSFDAASGEKLSDSQTPFSIEPLSPVLSDTYDRLVDMYCRGVFKGRQKQILKLLLEGETNQVEIAKLLNMKQYNVSKELAKIHKKLCKNIT